MRLRHPDDGYRGTGRVDAIDRGEHRGEGVVGLDRHDRKGDVFRRNRLAVVECGAGNQLEQQRLAVVLEAPAFGEIGQGVPFVVEPQRTGEQLRPDHRGGVAGLDGRVEMARDLAGAPHERAAGFLRERLGHQRQQCSECRIPDQRSDRGFPCNRAGCRAVVHAVFLFCSGSGEADWKADIGPAPLMRLMRASQSEGSELPRHATCWSGRESTSLCR